MEMYRLPGLRLSLSASECRRYWGGGGGRAIVWVHGRCPTDEVGASAGTATEVTSSLYAGFFF